MVDLVTRQEPTESEAPPPAQQASAPSKVEIETGVDRLLKLLHREKHVEMGAASKELGVPVEVVQDWVSFLEEEGLASTEYSLTKTFIVETPLSKNDVARMGEDYASKRDAFVRKVGSMLQDAEQEIHQLGDLKKEYSEFLNLSMHIDTVREDMELLRHFEQLKRTVDVDIRDQEASHEQALAQWHARIDAEEERYRSILAAINEETTALGSKRSELEDIRKDEEDVLKRVHALEQLMHATVDRIAAESTDIQAHEQQIKKMAQLAERLREDLSKDRKRALEPMIKISKDQEERINRLRESIALKIKDYFKNMQLDEDEAERTMKQLQQFFTTQARTASLISQIDRSETEIKEELVNLMRKAKAMDVALQEGGTNQNLKELEQAYGMLNAKRKTLLAELDQIHQPTQPI